MHAAAPPANRLRISLLLEHLIHFFIASGSMRGVAPLRGLLRGVVSPNSSGPCAPSIGSGEPRGNCNGGYSEPSRSLRDWTREAITLDEGPKKIPSGSMIHLICPI